MGVNDYTVDQTAVQWWPVKHYHHLFLGSMLSFIHRELDNILAFCDTRRNLFDNEQMSEFMNIAKDLKKDEKDCAWLILKGRVFYSTNYDVVVKMSEVKMSDNKKHAPKYISPRRSEGENTADQELTNASASACLSSSSNRVSNETLDMTEAPTEWDKVEEANFTM